jgi:hypothetical protein
VPESTVVELEMPTENTERHKLTGIDPIPEKVINNLATDFFFKF